MLTTKPESKRVRIKTVRPWYLPEFEMDGAEVVGVKGRRLVAVGDVVEVDRVLAGDIVSSGKAVVTEEAVGKAKADAKS